MRISYNPQQFFDAIGVPLSAGRVTLYVHDSDVPMHVYSLSGDVYSDASNPIILNSEGRMDTVWFDATVVDVKVEKHVGAGIYSTVDTFQYGFEPQEATESDTVQGIAGLSTAEPYEGRVVTVVGYDENCFAPPRNYVWDPTCTVPMDDGVIVGSEITEQGRWILLWDCETLPSYIYGVVPGHEANTAAFLGYPDFIGQWQIRTPSMPRFLSGTYTADTEYTTSRCIVFDEEARFTAASFNTPMIEVRGGNGYVADFHLSDRQDSVESGWFRTVQSFWSCGARRFNIGLDNFVEKAVTSQITLTNKVITGTKRIPCYYDGGARLVLDRCVIEGQVFGSSDRLRFKNCTFTDMWFEPNTVNWDIGDSTANRIIISEADNVVLQLSLFRKPEVYVRAAKAYGITELDLEGRTVSSMVNSSFSKVTNGVIGTLTNNVNCAFVNCTIGSMTSAASVTFYRTTANIAEFTGPGLEANDSEINCNQKIDNQSCAINVKGGRWYGEIGPSDTDDFVTPAALSFRDCIMNAPSGGFRGNAVNISNCTLHAMVLCYPYGVQGDSSTSYYLNVLFRGNTLVGNAYMMLNNTASAEWHANFEVHDVGITRLAITDNSFLQSNDTKGIHCPFWVFGDTDAGNYGSWRFLRGVNYASFPGYEYRNNVGACPAAAPADATAFTGSTYAYNTVSSYTMTSSVEYRRVFCLPSDFNDGGSGYGAIGDPHSIGNSGKRCMCYGVKATAHKSVSQFEGYGAPLPTAACLVPACANNELLDNDMFTVYQARSNNYYDTGVSIEYVVGA